MQPEKTKGGFTLFATQQTTRCGYYDTSESTLGFRAAHLSIPNEYRWEYLHNSLNQSRENKVTFPVLIC